MFQVSYITTKLKISFLLQRPFWDTVNLIKPHCGCTLFKGLFETLPAGAHAANSRDEAKLRILKAASSLLHNWSFVLFLASRPVTSLFPRSCDYKIVMNNTMFKKEPPFKCFSRNSGNWQILCEHLTCSLSIHCLCVCHVIQLFTTMGPENGWKQMGWKCFSRGPPKKPTIIISRTLSETCNDPGCYHVLTGVCDSKGLLKGKLLFYLFQSLSLFIPPENHRRCETPAWDHTARGLLASSLQDALCVFHHNMPICICF